MPEHPGSGRRFAAGQKVGPYSLWRFLGSGAFGEVWLAEKDCEIASPRLAVKLPLRGAADLSAVRKEAEVWARVGHHPNVQPMFEADMYDGQIVIVSEFAPDGSLERWLDRHGKKAPSIEAAVDVAMAILAGLEHLHVRKIIHRDLKPANVLMQGESPRIADFGLARVVEPGTAASMVAGAPAYMAPEAFDGVRSVRTDLWSAGVLLYQLLAGRLPFESVKAVLTEAPEPLPGSVPPTLREAVLDALHKNPQARFRSAADMRAGLRDARKDALGELETRTAPTVASRPPAVRTVAVTGSTYADPRRTEHRVRTLLAPYLGEYTTWYCGTVGAVDECVAGYLLEERQRVIAVGYAAGDISPAMRDRLARHGAPFVDAHDEQVPDVANAPSRRDLFFATKADLVVLLWNGSSRGTEELLSWLRRQGKDHIVGFV